VLCGDHAVAAVLVHRQMLVDQGHRLGEPPPRLVSFPDDSNI
jgi:hypothetical protein